MDYEEILSRLEELRVKKSRAEGKLESLMSELKEKFGYDSLQEAERGLKKLMVQRDGIEKELTIETDRFLKRWGDKI